MLLTTTSFVENYEVEDYLGVITSEVVLGTGFLSSLDAGIADLFGSESTGYSSKLQRAKDKAILELKSQANLRGADGIIGIDIDYTTFSADIIGCYRVWYSCFFK